MKILITGSNGLLGQKLVSLLANIKNVEVLATSKGENRLHQGNYQYHSLDITDQNQVNSMIDLYQPDAIINTAAMTNVDTCEVEKKLCWELNVTAVNYLIEASKRNNTHLIHLSTDFVFDGDSGPYKETDQPNPLSYYGKSKYEAEKTLQASSIKWSIVRTILVYGLTENMSRSNIVLWAKEALEKGTSLKVVNDQYRMPTLAEDLAMGCWLIAQKEKEGIYHLSGKDYMSILDLVCSVADFYKLDISTITPIESSSLNQTAKRPPITGFILNKAIDDLGYSSRSFVEGLEIFTEQLNSIN
tara:strand:+ start:1839 stop:2741 length:903 start_codon:yes stop_codon:yes gene_type:complete